MLVGLAVLACLPGLACSRRDTTDSLTAERAVAVEARSARELPAAPPSLGKAVRFEPIPVFDGLSQNAVLTIAQDERGFVWFGTEDGLNKYDGYEFRAYRHDAQDVGGLAHNSVSTLLADSQGVL